MEIIKIINKNKNKILHDIYVLKIYLLKSHDEENSGKLVFVESIYKGLDNRINTFINSLKDTDYNILENDYTTITSLLDELKNDVLAKQKLVGALMLDNMKPNELISFYDEYQKIMDKYENINIASSDILNSTRGVLSNFISLLLNYINTHDVCDKHLMPLKYLEANEAVNMLSTSEWLMLVKNLKLTMKYLNKNNDEEILHLRTIFIKINVYYFIVVSGGTF